MKIVVLQDFLRSGGTERQSILLANAFVAAGHPTLLLTFRPGGALGRTVSATVERRALQPLDLKIDWFAPGLLGEIRRFAPDVVLCMGRMANCYAGKIQRELPRVAVIATMRTGKRLPALFRRSLATVRHVVANSRDARDTLVNAYGIPAEKISVIHNSLVFPAPPATTPLAAVAREQLRRRHGASDSTLVMLCVAMFRPEKNQLGLIETVADLPRELDWQLWLPGEGPARTACERRVGSLNLGSRVKFLGFQPNPPAIYPAADVAVHASRSEALSNFLVEAQAHGLPAVVYQAQGMEECFIPEKTGWAIPPSDAPGFRAAILRLAHESAADRAERSAAARTFARNAFDPKRQVAAYVDLLQQLLSRSVP